MTWGRDAEIKVPPGQTTPPTVPVSKLYKNGVFPVGQIVEYHQEV